MVSRAATESTALAAAHASLIDDSEDDDSDCGATKRHHFKKLVVLESVKAKTWNREVAEANLKWLVVKTEAQEIAKMHASYRRLFVVTRGQLKRMRAVAKGASEQGPIQAQNDPAGASELARFRTRPRARTSLKSRRAESRPPP